jgi:carboxypeptidase T
MKKSLFFLFCCLPFFVFAQQSTYSRVKIYTDSKTPEQLFATGIEIIRADMQNNWYIAEISQPEISKLADAGFRYEVIIADVSKYYTERFSEKFILKESDQLLAQEWPQPVNFSLGSCGGFSTLDEMTAQLDLMRALYPSLISVKKALSDTISTIEGRTVYYVRISDNPDLNENEPEVLYTGMHHAREPIGMQHLLYYMWYLLENYNTDPSIKGLVDSTEMYFVPVFNVDGYTENITNFPGGGGMWRKNKRDNGDGSFGVDVNRNYGYEWGYDDIGSSPDPSDETYRGTAPFSEPENRMMKYFCEDHDFRIALNYHSYSNLFLYAWGWSPVPTADNNIFDAYANLMTQENNYTSGPGNTTIYPTNGGSDDWMYGEQTSKPATFAYTPEVGGNEDGFWPLQQRILPLIRENMLASFTAARLAGLYSTIQDVSQLFLYQQSGYLPFEIKRLGMQDGNFTVSVTPLGNAFAAIGDTKVIQGMALLEKRTDSISYELNNTLHVGDTIQYVLAISNGYFSEYDTVMRIYGYPYTVFNDALNSKSNWTGNWNLSTSQYFSPPASMTDSPSGNYLPNADKPVTLINGISLSNTLLMVLQFRAKWALEKDFDYVQVCITDDNGITWTPLQGVYTHPGTINQAAGQPVYDGKQGDWVRESISLNAYMGKTIKFRFRLRSDPGLQLDGFYFDDFNISMVLDPTSTGENNLKTDILGIPYPNPASTSFEVSYDLPKPGSDTHLIVSNVAGTEVNTIRLYQQKGIASIDISNLAAGIYFIRIESGDFQSEVRKLLVK